MRDYVRPLAWSLCLFAFFLQGCGSSNFDSVKDNVKISSPVLTSIVPPSVQVGSNAVLLTVSGSGFNNASQILIGGVTYFPVQSSATSLATVVPASVFSSAQSLDVIVKNVQSSGTESSALPFVIMNPAPQLKSITPGAVFQNSSGVVTISGEGFLAGVSTIQIAGTSVTPISVTSSTITFDTSRVDMHGTLALSISNPAPGGGTSSQNLVVLHAGEIAPTQHPLVASASAELPTGASFFVEFGEDTHYGRRTSTVISTNPMQPTTILVAGMRPSTQYHLRSNFELPDGTVLVGADRTFTTGNVDSARIPVTSVRQDVSLTASSGVELLDLVSGTSQQFRLAAFDKAGALIWFYDYPVSEGIPLGAKLLHNGNIGVVITRHKQVFREIDFSGKLLREITNSDLNQQLSAAGSPIVVAELHHDFTELPGGRIAFLYSETRNISGVTDYPVLGDGIIVVDSQGKIVWTWSSFDHMDTDRRPWWMLLKGQLPVFAYDWTHANAVVYSENDRSLLISMRHQNWVFKIDFQDGVGSGNILWHLGNGGDFTLQNSSDSADWFYDQHYPFLISDSGSHLQVAILDNGNQRPTDALGTQCMTNNTCYSRPVVISLDENSKIATLDWAPHVSYSNFGGSIQKLGEGRIEYTLSAVPGRPGGSIVESTMDEVPVEVWRMDVNQLVYRGQRLPSLYPNITWSK